MPEYYPCPYLGGEVEVTDERYAHVLDHHADFAPVYWGRVAETLLGPDQVLSSKRDADAILFFRWYPDVSRHVAVVVNIGVSVCRWLMTAHFARKLEGELLWVKN